MIVTNLYSLAPINFDYLTNRWIIEDDLLIF